MNKRASKKSTPHARDATLLRAEELLAAGPAPTVDLIAEYAALAASYQSLLHKLDKTLVISDGYQSQLLEFNATLSQKVAEETEHRLSHERNLAQNAKLAAMGELLGVIAHQWRQPLSALAMIIQRLIVLQQQGGLSGKEIDSSCQRAMEQIRHMSETIDEFRLFYSPDRLSEFFSPGDKLREAIQLVLPHFTTTGIELEVQTPATVEERLYGFPNQFKQALINLLANAREAILERRAQDALNFTGHISIRLSTDPKNCCIAITDNGCGVPPALSVKLFDPFTTSKSASGGSGIGLFLVRTIIKDGFSGELNYRSHPGDTTFTLSIPFPRREPT